MLIEGGLPFPGGDLKKNEVINEGSLWVLETFLHSPHDFWSLSLSSLSLRKMHPQILQQPGSENVSSIHLCYTSTEKEKSLNALEMRSFSDSLINNKRMLKLSHWSGRMYIASKLLTEELKWAFLHIYSSCSVLWMQYFVGYIFKKYISASMQ